MSEWVSVKDKLPDKIRICFACNRVAFAPHSDAYLFKVAYYDGVQFRNANTRYPTDVDYWMYPPKVRDEGE